MADKSKKLIFDLNSIFSRSENLKMAAKGYNKEHPYLKQINFLLFYSPDRHLPLMLRPLDGSIKDIKALKGIIDETNIKNCILVIDRGFASYYLPKELRILKCSFIFPFRRDFKKINYKMKLDNNFIYRERGIKWGVKKAGNYLLYLFEDIQMKAEEETNFFKLMKEGKKQRKTTKKNLRNLEKSAYIQI